MHRSAIFRNRGIGGKVGDLESGGPLAFGGAASAELAARITVVMMDFILNEVLNSSLRRS